MMFQSNDPGRKLMTVRRSGMMSLPENENFSTGTLGSGIKFPKFHVTAVRGIEAWI